MPCCSRRVWKYGRMLVFATSINTMPHLHYPSLPASPSVVWRVPRNSSKSDTHTRVRHQHLHQCPCNSLEHFLALVLVSFSMNDSYKRIGCNLIFHKNGDSFVNCNHIITFIFQFSLSLLNVGKIILCFAYVVYYCLYAVPWAFHL